MKKLFLTGLSLMAVAVGLLVATRAQEIATPVSDGANETVTLKKVVRVSSVNIQRNANVVFSRERVAVNNAATATDVVPATQAAPTYRAVNAVLAESVTAGTKTVTFQQLLDLLGKFQEKWAAEDAAALAAKQP